MTAPDGDDWLHELRYLGLPVRVRKTGDDVRVEASDGDRTEDVPELADAVRRLPEDVDAEGIVTVLLPDGRSSPEALGAVLDGAPRTGLALVLLDVRSIGGAAVRGGLLARKEKLRALVAGSDVRFADHVVGNGPAFFAQACALGAAGVMSRRVDGKPGDMPTITPCPKPRPRRTTGKDLVLGLAISKPSREVWPGFTKLDLARYWEAVADRALPHVRGRPLTLLRCAGPVGEGCEFLRHARVWGPEVLRRVHVPEQRKVGEYLVVEDAAGLVALAQMDVVEVHPWNTRIPAVERPDRVVLDLDPGPQVPWPEVVEAAFLARDRLAALGLRSWVKTTGGNGLHVVAPLDPALTWRPVFAFAKSFARLLASEDRRLTIQVPKEGRERRILVDYLRNNRTNTSVAAYSPRARDGATVSWPVAWEDLDAVDVRDFTVRTVPKLPNTAWDGYFTCRQRLPDDVVAKLTGD